MRVEVEQKFALGDDGSADRFQEDVLLLGGTWGLPCEQVDTYFAHPARDFSLTDEALRIRRQDDAVWVTYKGPKLDATTKTRHEIDAPLSDAAGADDFANIFTALGFNPVADVRKTRSSAKVPWAGCEIEVSLDEVPPLGHFAELEIVATEKTIDAARAAVASLAKHLGLRHGERRSYLELLLDA